MVWATELRRSLNQTPPNTTLKIRAYAKALATWGIKAWLKPRPNASACIMIRDANRPYRSTRLNNLRLTSDGT